jgi:hypothetical protein
VRDRLNYANVTATLALFVALGGSSYAALKITGRNVVNGSLTGKDIKKRSVTLDRLRGTLPAGATGAQGPKGDQGLRGETGPAGSVDTSQFVPSAGLYRVSVGPTAWVSNNPALTRSVVAADQVVFTSSGAPNTAALAISPALPSMIAGRSTRLRAAELCWDASDVNMLISAAYITVSRGPLTNSGQGEIVGENADENDHNENACTRYDLSPALDLSGGGQVSARISVGWNGSPANLKIAGATFEFDRAP